MNTQWLVHHSRMVEQNVNFRHCMGEFVICMLLNSNFEGILRFFMWVEADTTATTMDGILIGKDGIPPNNLFGERYDATPG